MSLIARAGRLLPLLLLLALLPACDGGAPDDDQLFTCQSLGLGTQGTMTADLRVAGVTVPFEPTCLRVTVESDVIVVRGIVTSGPILERDIVLLAPTTEPTTVPLSIALREASATYATPGRTLNAVEGTITIDAVTASDVSGTFDFVTSGNETQRVSVAGGTFQIPR